MRWRGCGREQKVALPLGFFFYVLNVFLESGRNGKNASETDDRPAVDKENKTRSGLMESMAGCVVVLLWCWCPRGVVD